MSLMNLQDYLNLKQVFECHLLVKQVKSMDIVVVVVVRNRFLIQQESVVLRGEQVEESMSMGVE
jgi:hypothetical protein